MGNSDEEKFLGPHLEAGTWYPEYDEEYLLKKEEWEGREAILPKIKLKLDGLEKSFSTGKDPSATLEAIRFCIIFRLAIPEWAQTAFLSVLCKATRGEYRSWDQAWGRPPTRGKAVRFWRDYAGAGAVTNAVDDANQPKTDELFARVGRQLGIGGATRVKQVYRSLRADFRRLYVSKE